LLDLVNANSREAIKTMWKSVLAGKLPETTQTIECTLADDHSVSVSAYFSILDPAVEHVQYLLHLIDITEQKNLEQRFAHSQKMQAVGQLAGGVAHDFNNLLTAMIGFCDLLLMRHPAGDQSFADIMQIKQNANRAANLVRQLLAFSRKQTLQPKMLDITEVMAELSNLIRRLIGENIELNVMHGRNLGHIKADQGQLEQVIINLAVNARDAMKEGGQLTIQSSQLTVDKDNPLRPTLFSPEEEEQIVPGEYILIEVVDTGSGIPKDILQKVFEPFFSTKEVGAGTGLGLATVYGIIKQTGGYIYVESNEGSGTNFSLFFQKHDPKPEEEEKEEHVTASDLTGSATILLVEDETPVRTFAARALSNKGYTIIEADCGEQALEIMAEQGKEIELIVSDVIMPGIKGTEMVKQVLPNYPDVKVIFMSGYAEDVFSDSFGDDRTFEFLAKPFTLKALASKVKEVVEG
jgi:two-component system cell cycle sensor histidine kinase/response regulator CckA